MMNFTMFPSGNTITRMNKSRMTWPGHVACMGEKTYVHKIRRENLMEINHLEDLGAERNMVLKWI